MKALLFISCNLSLFCLFCCTSLVAQNGNSFSVDPQVFDVKLSLVRGSIVYQDSGAFVLTKNLNTAITKIQNDTIYLHFQDDDSNLDQIGPQGLLGIDIDKHYAYVLIDQSYTNKFRFYDWDIRPLTIPVKIRPKLDTDPIQFIGDVAIGPYLGFQRGTRRFQGTKVNDLSSTACIFATPTYIRLDPTNTTGTQSMNANGNTVLGASLGGGLLFDVNTTQFGLVAGIDYIAGDASESWIYQGQMWYSVSVGFQLSNN